MRAPRGALTDCNRILDRYEPTHERPEFCPPLPLQFVVFVSAILAILILVYACLYAASALRSFYFFQRVERLEIEAHRVMALFAEGGAQSPLKKQTVGDVTLHRRDGEVKSYMDLFFLAAVVLLCVAKIMAD